MFLFSVPLTRCKFFNMSTVEISKFAFFSGHTYVHTYVCTRKAYVRILIVRSAKTVICALRGRGLDWRVRSKAIEWRPALIGGPVVIGPIRILRTKTVRQIPIELIRRTYICTVYRMDRKFRHSISSCFSRKKSKTPPTDSFCIYVIKYLLSKYAGGE